MKVNVGGVEITNKKIEKIKKTDEVSAALTIWEKIQKFFHIGNIEEKEKILSLIKDVFINKEPNLYQRIESFKAMKELSKNNNSSDDFKIEVVDDLLCLSIGKVDVKYEFTKEEDIIEIEKIKKIQENLIEIKLPKTSELDNEVFKYLILELINKENTNSFDEKGMINIDNIDKEKTKANVMKSIINEMKRKINAEVIDESIFYSENIKYLEKKTDRLKVNTNEFIPNLNNLIKNVTLGEITNTLHKDLLRMDYHLLGKELIDKNIIKSKIKAFSESNEDEETKENEIERLKLNLMNKGLNKIEEMFKNVDEKIIIYNLISQGVFNIVKDSFHGIDPLFLLGFSPIDGKSTIMIDKDKDENLVITVSNKKTLNEKDELGKKNADSFFSKYINQGLTFYTKSKINLLHFLCDNALNKPSNSAEVFNILDENDVYQELDPSKSIPLLEENIQLVFTYNVKNQNISVDPQKSYYEYSYLNI
ncbi:hypothetical protein QSH14_07110 [Proteus faecis]|uniref:Uncharacterized protein n=1 Tax=Proteus faecis TaxID=2050967 RepID=A0AAW7CPP7_9GAMM|nr:hypothetical protein [Proteus faecis]MDL5167055.1 hypothetical protein [Proteus faecis]MDL5274839.1 hypothetical protein [Proteus faecis]MDL5278408.1 hypothetical protein [Proteus faecis]MDL5307410.1 hypothetical protein [Proteus faecis]MDL5310968.1 hypothetical protein [Proteus faecis]